MIKEYKCSKCSHVFTDEVSDTFIKTTLKKCPVCGSSEVSLNVVKRNKFAKKTRE